MCRSGTSRTHVTCLSMLRTEPLDLELHRFLATMKSCRRLPTPGGLDLLLPNLEKTYGTLSDAAQTCRRGR